MNVDGASQFAPGFRLSALDVVVLIAGVAGTFVLGRVTWWWGFVLALVLGHFFLFCNVVRMARPLELVWALVFVLLAAPTIAVGQPGWLLTALGTLLATVILVLIEMRKPSYHGVGWQWLNPGLPAWWESHSAQGGRR
jgi:hypothetical protein